MWFLAYLRDVDQQSKFLDSNSSENYEKKLKAFSRIQQALIAAQELGDEKLNVVQNLLDLIENKTRQLDLDLKNLGESIRMKYYVSLIAGLLYLKKIYIDHFLMNLYIKKILQFHFSYVTLIFKVHGVVVGRYRRPYRKIY